METQFMIIAHRGASGYRPENTLAAFKEAAAMGIGHLECDVRLSRDAGLVVIHDETVDRTTDGSGRVAELELGQLKALDAGGWFAPRFRGERIPLLEEVIGVLAEESRLVVEIKEDERFPRLTDAVLHLLEQRKLSGRVGISSFDWEVLRRVRERSAGLQTSALLPEREWFGSGKQGGGLLERLLAEAGRLRVDVLCPKASSVRSQLVEALHAGGYLVRAWRLGGRDEQEVARLIACGVDGMTTDYPDVLARLYNSLVAQNQENRGGTD